MTSPPQAQATPARSPLRRGEPLRPGVSGEFGLIDAFLRPFGGRFAQASGVLVGPGSDCAVVQPARGQKLVVTTDAAVENVHFTLRHFSPEDVGHKALAINLSDLAAAGARPRWFLCALGVPRNINERSFINARALAVGMAEGMAELARRHEVALVGGNVTAASEWSITITALGEAARPLTRDGGRAGDALVLAGQLGAAACGLRALRNELRNSRKSPIAQFAQASPAVRAQLRPEPLVAEGLAAARFASAAIDVSDGLLADLGHLCRASGCGAELEGEALPVAEGATFDEALSGGEDYALLVAVPPRKLAGLLRALPGARRIGALQRRAGLRILRNGRPLRLPARRGFDHLRR